MDHGSATSRSDAAEPSRAFVQLAERRALRAASAASSGAGAQRWPVLAMERGHAVVDLRQADAVGVEHRPAAPGGEAVAVQRR